MRAVKPYDKYVDVNELRLHYPEWGHEQGQPMILLHDFLAHAHARFTKGNYLA